MTMRQIRKKILRWRCESCWLELLFFVNGSPFTNVCSQDLKVRNISALDGLGPSKLEIEITETHREITWASLSTPGPISDNSLGGTHSWNLWTWLLSCWRLVLTITIVFGNNSFVGAAVKSCVNHEPDFGSDRRHGATIPVNQHDLFFLLCCLWGQVYLTFSCHTGFGHQITPWQEESFEDSRLSADIWLSSLASTSWLSSILVFHLLLVVPF